MNTNSCRRTVWSVRFCSALFGLAAWLTVGSVHAADGVWAVDNSGSWVTTGNWVGGTIADGSGSIAFFTNDISATRTVSLGATARTIGHLVISDASPGASVGGWTFARTTTALTLAAGVTPTITVSNLAASFVANIRYTIGGSQGFTKLGDGVLQLGGSSTYANTYSGVTTINAGAITTSTSSSGDVMIPGDLVINSGGSFTNITVDNIADSATVTVNAGAVFAQGISSSKSEVVANVVVDGGTVVENSTSTLTVTNGVDARSGLVAGTAGKLDVGTFTKSTAGAVTLQTKGTAATSGGLTNTIVNAGTLVFDYTQDASKLLDTGSLTINGGTLVISNGTHTEVVGAVTLTGGVITNAGGSASLSLSTGNYDVRAGSIYARLRGTAGLTKSTAGEVVLGGTAVNSFSGDTRLVAGSLTLLGQDALASSTLDANASDTGTLGVGDSNAYRIGGLKGSRNLSVTQTNGGGALLRVGGNNQTTTYSGNLGPSSATTLEKYGTGTLFLDGTYACGVNVFAGTLGGNGTFNASFDVSPGGKLSPGHSIGAMNLFSLSIANGGTVVVEIDKTAGTNDYLNASATVSYGGTLVVSNLTAAFAGGDSFKLFNGANYTGSFTNISPATPGANLAWDTSSLTNNGTLKVVSTGGGGSQPRITSIAISGNQAIIGGTNGTPSGNYAVLSSTDIGVAVTNWTSLQTNQFDGSGNFSATNAYSPTEISRFYIIQVQP